MRSEYFFERGLHAGGKVMVARQQRLIGFPRRPQPLLEVRGKEPALYGCPVGFAPTHLRALALVRKIFEPQAKRKRLVGAYDPAEFLQELRLAVGRETHDLVFVAEFPETQVLRQGGIEDSQRMRKADLAKCAHPRPFAEGPHGAREIA